MLVVCFHGVLVESPCHAKGLLAVDGKVAECDHSRFGRETLRRPQKLPGRGIRVRVVGHGVLCGRHEGSVKVIISKKKGLQKGRIVQR